MKRTQTQVHCPKGGNSTAKWPECLLTQGKAHSNAARRLTLSLCGWAVAPRPVLDLQSGPQWKRNIFYIKGIFSAIFPSFLIEMNENPRNPIHRVQLGSACVDSKGGRLSEDGLQWSLIGLFGGPDWNMPMVRAWDVGLCRISVWWNDPSAVQGRSYPA
uniref:Uncharacterized protein n=1 Tax=Pipistrellus kuhlii TaxID=59472 RepID=A0A7J7ZJZ8_PIPKU|nr:hypothetical protein mPipKuh1_009637 [Pipistrellus kuhlii]